MTEKQAERLRQKIKKIKSELAADKRRWGGYYDDSRGIRYLPPQYYIKLGDFAGGLRYFNWFRKNFPSDIGFPDFLFEWTIILFKKSKLKEAEKKMFETFRSNTYIIDKFFGRPLVPINKYEYSNIDSPAYLDDFMYSHKNEELTDFSEWLNEFTNSEKFKMAGQQYIDIYKQLYNKKDSESRQNLLKQARQLIDHFEN